MTLSNGLKFWGLTFITLILFFWVFTDALMPFIVGLILAYILSPLVDILETEGLSRLLATNIVLFSFLGFCSLFFILLVPIVSDQLMTFVKNVPQFQNKIVGILNQYLGFNWKTELVPEKGQIEKHFADYGKNALGATTNVISGLFSFSMILVQKIAFIIIVPVVAFYFLLDWQILISKIDSWLPRRHAVLIRQLVGEMDEMQAAFIRGQSLVCLIQATYYVVVLTALGVNYSITLGLITGLISFIPYIGSGLGFLVIMLVAAVQYLPEYTTLIWIAVTFAIGQTLEGYVWIPKIIGDSVSLHPLWVMFSLLAFGSLMGLSGMLIAVPVTAAIGVLTRFVLERYILSPYYSGNTTY